MDDSIKRKRIHVSLKKGSHMHTIEPLKAYLETYDQAKLLVMMNYVHIYWWKDIHIGTLHHRVSLNDEFNSHAPE